jgi:hypothetical protein
VKQSRVGCGAAKKGTASEVIHLVKNIVFYGPT